MRHRFFTMLQQSALNRESQIGVRLTWSKENMAEFKLTEIVERVDHDKLVIPEFQRGFKWQTPDIRKLLESLLLDFPIGAALFWRTQRSTLDFRRIEEVQFSDEDQEEGVVLGHSDETALEEIDFILDGQQRITSIYKLFPAELAPTEHEMESRFRGLRFFLALEKLGLPRKLADLKESDYERYKDPDQVASAIVEKRHPDLRKEYRLVSGDKAPQRLSNDNILFICQRRLWLPLTRALLENKQAHLQRLRRVVEADLRSQLDSYSGSEPRNTLENLIETGLDRWADWFTSSFQATLNSKSLTCLLIPGNDKPEGLARIFETINSTGLSLSVFDLLVARLGTWKTVNGAATNLRKLVLSKIDKPLLQKFDDDRSLGGTASQQLPRLLALRAGIELKKGEILKTQKKVFLDVTEEGGVGLQCALSTLTLHMGVIDDSYLPFKDLIALIGALYSSRWDEVKDRVIAALWTICLVEDWDSSTNDKTRYWYRQVNDILNTRQPASSLFERLEQHFPSFEDIRDATSKASIAFRSIMAFNLSRGVSIGQALPDPRTALKRTITYFHETGSETIATRRRISRFGSHCGIQYSIESLFLRLLTRRPVRRLHRTTLISLPLMNAASSKFQNRFSGRLRYRSKAKHSVHSYVIATT
jgi:hypothetical protein